MTTARVTVVVTPNEQHGRRLSPNQARNAALAGVRTEYVVFVGNDVLVADGWLDPLVACADEEHAAFVAGVVLVAGAGGPRVYFAGGKTHIVERDGRRRVRDVHHLAGRQWSEVRDGLARAPSEAGVLHCLPVRTKALERIVGFDEHLWALEHVDLCLRLQRAGAVGWFEPRAIITWVPPSARPLGDLRAFLVRWSRARVDASVAHFVRAWDLDPADPGLDANLRWIEEHRWFFLRRARAAVRRRFGDGALHRVDAVLDALVDLTLVRIDARRHG